MALEQKKSFKDYVKIKSLTEIDPSRVVALGVTGLFIGSIIGVFAQVAKLDLKSEGKLDPDAPNMEELEPELVVLYSKFMGPFFRLCPERNRKTYKNYVRNSIRKCRGCLAHRESATKGRDCERTSKQDSSCRPR